MQWEYACSASVESYTHTYYLRTSERFGKGREGVASQQPQKTRFLLLFCCARTSPFWYDI